MDKKQFLRKISDMDEIDAMVYAANVYLGSNVLSEAPYTLRDFAVNLFNLIVDEIGASGPVNHICRALGLDILNDSAKDLAKLLTCDAHLMVVASVAAWIEERGEVDDPHAAGQKRLTP